MPNPDPTAGPPAIMIAACGAVTAAGRGLPPLAHALAHNTVGLRPCPRLTGKGYQSHVAGAVSDDTWESLRTRTPAAADAAAFLLADEALRQVRSAAKAIPGQRLGLVLSTTKADIIALERLQAGQSCSAMARRDIRPAQLAADLAAAHDIAGPIECVSVACVSGLIALQLGTDLLRQDQADAVFVVGVDLLSHFVMAGFTALKSLDPTGCRPFDQNRTGLSLGEGAGAILLTREGRARPPGLRRDEVATATQAGAPSTDGPAVRPYHITGWGSSNDANHLTGPSRDGAGLASAIDRALQRAGLRPDQIDYVHAHGTGTLYNDSMEALALQWVFDKRVPPFSSAKGLLGHTLGAAGILETILCVVAAQTGTRPGTPRLTAPATDMPAALQRDPLPGAPLHAILKINAGFGGTNAALILEQRPT